jgi:hypothetical protein
MIPVEITPYPPLSQEERFLIFERERVSKTEYHFGKAKLLS